MEPQVTPQATCSPRILGLKRYRLGAILMAAVGAVASAYFAALTPQVPLVHISALVVGAIFSLSAAMAMIFWKSGRAAPRVTLTVTGVLTFLAALSVTGLCSLLAVEGPRRHHIAELVTRLQTKSFYQHAAPGIAELRKESRTVEEVVIDEGTGRAYPFDPVDLAQGGATRLMLRMSTFLRTQGISIHTLQSTLEVGGVYVLRIDRVSGELLSAGESSAPHAGHLCAARIARMVNTFLREARSAERLQLFRTGREWAAVFLTDDQKAILRGAGAFPEELD